MGKFIDFAELKERVSIEQVVDMLGLDLKRSGNQLRGQCPACGGGDRNLVVTPERGAFYCFADKKGGDQIALAAHILGVGMKQAATLIAERYGLSTGNSTGTSTSSRTRPQERGEPKENGRSLQPLNHLEPEHDAVVAIGLDTEVAKALGIGYRTKGAGLGSVMIPVRDERGDIKGYLGVQELTYIPKDFQPQPTNVVPIKKTA